MAKNNRSGQAAIWNERTIKKLRSRLTSPQQKLIFEISLCTGERMGTIVQLKVSDVYDHQGKVLNTITFGKTTRKSSKHGLAETRQIPIHPDLRTHLQQYSPPNEGYLFPSNSSQGHITRRAVDKYWRERLQDMGFSGFSTHSSRRWVINKLREAGTEISIIAETMRINISTVRRYLDDDPAACERAIASLPV